MSDRHARVAELLHGIGADALLAGDPGTVAWLSGVEVSIDTGPSPFAIGPFALVEANGDVLVFASEDEPMPDGVEVVRYEGFTVGPIDRLGAVRRATADLLDGRWLAIEAASIPAGLVAQASGWVDATEAILRARAVKDPDEIDRLRAAIALCDAGQAALRSALEPGITELELWSTVRRAIDARAAAPTPLLADLVSGPRTAEIGGPPGPRVLAPGELVLCDLVPRRAGVWGDSCATLAVGEPSSWAREAHRRALESLEVVIGAVRPGVRAGDLDRLVRDRLDGLPHHVGHGIGGSSHEEPRIVPGSETLLEPGMVIALEPAVYGDSEGVRVERVVLVTGDGCELLSGHDLAL
jgi:Xaa-Pro aminopeptidase